MSIQFTKMQGLGNDFMVIDAIHQRIDLNPKKIQTLSCRDTGVGFDQCLLIEKSTQPNIDFFYRIYNADGTEVGQCGNGARCLARFVHHYQLSSKKIIRVATTTTTMQLLINDDDTVSVNLGKPKLNPRDIPLISNELTSLYALSLSGDIKVQFHALSVGNPHAIIPVADVKTAEVALMGKAISKHALFPEGTNVGFMQILGPDEIKLRVYERGAGETKACGSGAVAAVVAGRLYHKLAARVSVFLSGGKLRIDWPNIKGDVHLTGPGEFVYEGQLMMNEL